MNILKSFIISASLLVVSGSASATVIDFKWLADHAVADGGLGERGWDSGVSDLMFDASGDYTTSAAAAFLTITATNGGGSNAYLDEHNAGLGVCGTLTDPGLQCNPSSDDNVSYHSPNPEVLHFEFAADVIIDKIWLNNNHDGDRSLEGDYVSIDGSGVLLGAPDSTGDSMLALDQFLSAGDFFDIGFDLGQLTFDDAGKLTGGCEYNGDGDSSMNNCEFYVSKIEYSTVPEPTILALLGLGLFGMAVARRRQLK